MFFEFKAYVVRLYFYSETILCVCIEINFSVFCPENVCLITVAQILCDIKTATISFFQKIYNYLGV